MTIHFGQDIAYEALDSQIEMFEDGEHEAIEMTISHAMQWLALVSLSIIAAGALVCWGAP